MEARVPAWMYSWGDADQKPRGVGPIGEGNTPSMDLPKICRRRPIQMSRGLAVRSYLAIFCECSCVLCAVCLGGVYRQYFCSGLAMVIAANVGHIRELPRLSCLRWHILGMCRDAGLGRSPDAARRQLHISHTLATARTGPGALRGRSPRTREGRIGPTAHNCSGQWLGASCQRPRFSCPSVDRGMAMA